MIKAGIVGGTGYTGVELLRLLAVHPAVKLEVITSRSEAGREVAELFPNLRNHVKLRYTAPDGVSLRECDVVFFATPNGIAMGMVPELLDAGIRVIDLAADFRLRDPEEWLQWYGIPHSCPELLAEAVYGLPEMNRKALSEARLVASPGCYPTAVQLGFLPLLENGVVDGSTLIADVKSGVSGAGRKAGTALLLAECSESMKAYAVPGHRHLPEIRQGLMQVAHGEVELLFVPHLTPMIRGIHATLYASLKRETTDTELQELFEHRYGAEPFVDVMPFASHPESRSVKGSNMCRIALHRPQGGERVVVLVVIDNLVKGAAGQAVQSMNLMFGLDECTGLEMIAMLP